MNIPNSDEYKPLSHHARNLQYRTWFRQKLFLEMYDICKANLKRASKNWGMSPALYYRWMRTDKDFNDAARKIQQKYSEVADS